MQSNTQRRIIYIGYWLSNDDISLLVNRWKDANITHVIFTFITQLDTTKPLSNDYSMALAYKDLSSENQMLLKNNFTLGVSYGGGAAMPSPYSNTFSQGAYYQNNPEQLAQDVISLCGDLNQYYDLDIEHIDDKFDECAEFLGKVCVELRRLNPSCQISHAPQPPYFTPQYQNIYNKIYENYKNYFNFFNIQYYNNGPSNSYEEIFISSSNDFSNVAVLQLINNGIKGSYINVGKPVNENEGNAGGYVPLVPTLGDIIEKAFNNKDLGDWSSKGGVMIWYYNTQNQAPVDNDNIIEYMRRISLAKPVICKRY